MSLEQFRDKVQEYRRPVGQSQKALANRLGLHPTVLSHKLNKTGNIILTHAEIKTIIKTLAEWGAINQQTEAIELLELSGLKANTFSPEEWQSQPLKLLEKTTYQQAALAVSYSSSQAEPLRHNLPAQTTSLVGRKTEIEKIRAMLKQVDIRLLTLTGPGGTGKTRLGLQVAAESYADFEDGVFFVPLSTAIEEVQVLTALTQILEVKESVVKGRPRSLLQSLKEYLAPRQMLLVLDNFEQVLIARNLLADLLQAAPRLKLLITSRTLLQIYGEHEFAVPILSLPANIDGGPLPETVQIIQYEAIELFVQRSKAVRSNFELNETNALAVVEICTRLDGLPLAIELAAARSRLFTPQAMLTQLAARNYETGSTLNFLSRGAQNLPTRQQTLRNTLDWSYALLDEPEKQLFQQLAVFTGGFGLQAVEAVCQCLDGLNALESLLSKSMLVQLESVVEGELRFSMLETIREYALEKLVAGGTVEEVYDRHLEYFAGLIETAEQEMNGIEQAKWLKQLESEHGNSRLALSWALQEHDFSSAAKVRERLELALRLVGALGLFWEIIGHMSEGRDWLERVLKRAIALKQTEPYAKALVVAGALALTQSDALAAQPYYELSLEISRALNNKRLIAQAFNRLGQIARMQGDYVQARDLGEQSLSLRRELNDGNGIARSLVSLAITARYTGEFLTAQKLYEESIRISRELGDKRMVALTLNNLGEAYRYQGKLEQSIQCQEEALAMRRELGDKAGVATSLVNLGESAYTIGDYQKAQKMLQESLLLHRQLNYRYGLVYALNSLGETLCSQGNYATARPLLEEALQIGQAIGDQTLVAMTINSLAVSAIGLGEGAIAYRLAEQSLSLQRRVGNKFKIAETLVTLGQASLLQNNYKSGTISFREALQLFYSLNIKNGMAVCLIGLAGIALSKEQSLLATSWLGIAFGLTAKKISRSASETFFYEKYVELARAELGLLVFEQNWLKAQVLEATEVVQQALEIVNSW